MFLGRLRLLWTCHFCEVTSTATYSCKKSVGSHPVVCILTSLTPAKSTGTSRAGSPTLTAPPASSQAGPASPKDPIALAVGSLASPPDRQHDRWARSLVLFACGLLYDCAATAIAFRSPSRFMLNVRSQKRATKCAFESLFFAIRATSA